ncbi:serine hydrolase domain-containing protein [Streptomyces sp. M19]
MTELNGTVSPTFEPVRDAVEDRLRSGAEVGLSLVVDVDGQHVVDLWGGHRDATRALPWQRDTITNVWSITKTVTSLAALLLVDAGELDVYAPVARYWPEFAANGKDHVEVRHLLSHTSGVSGLDHPRGLRTCTTCAQRPPEWLLKALVGAGHGFRLPRPELRPPGWRTGPPPDRPATARLRAPAHRQASRRRLPDRAA